MKAIIFEDHKGVKNFLAVFSAERVLEVFKKISRGSGSFFITSEEQFNELKESYEMSLTDFIYKKFLGIGMYDWDGNFQPKLIQPEGLYSIEEFVEKTNNVNINKIVIDKMFLN